MKVLAWGSSDTGRARAHNEDSFLVDVELGLFAVADGMGGHRGGEIASKMALDVMSSSVRECVDDLAACAARLRRERLAVLQRTTQPVSAMSADGPVCQNPNCEDPACQDPECDAVGEDGTDPLVTGPVSPAGTVIMAAARKASISIFDRSLEDSELRGMGTTLTALFYDTGRMHLVHAGDSRAYLFRDGKLEQLTDDHSWIAEQVRSGAMTEEAAKQSRLRHIITRSVGFEREVELDSAGIGVEAGDCFLLCSDGMSNYIDNSELESILTTTWHKRAPDLLIELANERGGDDNITVVVVCLANHEDQDVSEATAE